MKKKYTDHPSEMGKAHNKAHEPGGTFETNPEKHTPHNYKSPIKQKADPDAPGTPGEPGYEPPVKREDLDALGKKIWDCNNNPETRWNNKTKKCEPIKKD